MTRLILGLVLGVILVFPGAELVRWLASQVFCVYTDMTLTDACLAMIIILQAVIIVRGARPGPARKWPPPMEMVGGQVEVRPPVPPRKRRPRPRRRRSADAGTRVQMTEDEIEERIRDRRPQS